MNYKYKTWQEWWDSHGDAFQSFFSDTEINNMKIAFGVGREIKSCDNCYFNDTDCIDGPCMSCEYKSNWKSEDAL